MRSARRGAARLALFPLLLMGALGAWQLIRGLGGPFPAATVVTSALLLIVGVLAAWHLATGAGAAAVRRGALLSALLTLVLVLNCSATGVSNASGMGYQLAFAAPSVYLGVLLLLVGPLLVSLIVPALVAERQRATVVASLVSGLLSLATAETGLVTSFSGFCSRFGSSAGESACITASTGALAGIFGLFGVLLVLPFTIHKPAPGPAPSSGGSGPEG